MELNSVFKALMRQTNVGLVCVTRMLRYHIITVTLMSTRPKRDAGKNPGETAINLRHYLI